MANTQEEIISLEKKFWAHMTAGELEDTGSLLAEHSVAVSDHGAFQATPTEFIEMAKKYPWTYDRWDLSDMKVLSTNDDVAVIYYKADIDAHGNGQHVKARTLNTTTWVRQDDEWKALIHTETKLSDEGTQPTS